MFHNDKRSLRIAEKALLRAWKRLSGGRWMQGEYEQRIKGRQCYCAMGSLITSCTSARTRDMENLGTEALRAALPEWADGGVITYNDDPRCEFRHIRALFAKALRMVRAELGETHRGKVEPRAGALLEAP